MTSRRKRLTPTSFDYQRLESRQLLAGNVSVSLQGDVLQIIGDGAGNEIRVSGTANGRARVVPIGGTTINGGGSAFEPSALVRNVAIQMNGGNDSAIVENLANGGYLDLDLGAGNDTLEIREINVRTLNVNGRSGNDVLQFHNTFSPGYITLQSHEGDDTFSITAMATNKGLLLDTGDGADLVAIDNLGIRENLVLSTASGDDQVVMTGNVYSHLAQFNLGAGNDSLIVTPRTSNTTAQFQKQFSVRAGDGNDRVFVGPSTTARKGVAFDGGNGSDAIGTSGTDMRRPEFSLFENRSLSNVTAEMDAFYARLQSLNIDTTPFGRAFEPAGTLTLSSTPLKHYGQTPAGAVDNGIVLSGPSNMTVSQARVRITGGFVSGQDVLAFTNTSNISGSFNSTTGELTLTGTGSVADFQSALRSVTYDNSSTTTLEATRRIEVLVSTSRGSLSGSRDIDLGDQLTIQAYKQANGLTTQTTASGLHYIIDTVGNGTHPTISDTVRVNYVGRLLNGTQFDANNNITFPLSNVIVGWQEGIPLFSVGGSGRLIIPSSLAYGPNGSTGIPANSVLIFNVDLLDIV